MGKKETSTEEEDKNVKASDLEEVRASWLYPSNESKRLYWLINLMRSGVVLSSVVIVLLVYQYLDVFISVAGAIFGMANVLLLPSLAHLKLLAETPAQRYFDYFIIGFSGVMMVFLPFTILYYGS